MDNKLVKIEDIFEKMSWEELEIVRMNIILNYVKTLNSDNLLQTLQKLQEVYDVKKKEYYNYENN